MSGIDTMLHPTFEALSAHADAADDVASATRVGRHVARCAQCRDQVAEIRALGDAARAMAVPGAPAGLWTRIETAAAAPSRGSARGHLPSMPADLPAPASRRHRAVVIAAAVLGVAVAAVALWPRPSSLEAAGPSRLTFTPARPVPGEMVTVRYRPPAALGEASRFVLIGRFARPAGGNPPRVGSGAFDQLADSIGELARTADGAFVGTVRLPADFLALSLAVRASDADRLDLDGTTPWMIIGGSPGRGPSLASLLAAAETHTESFGTGRSRPRGQAIDVADSLKRYFPRHPAGWAYTSSYGVSRGRFDLLRFFESGERKYASMFDALWPQPALDAERLHAMVVFSNRIDESGEALRWAARLVEEHPEDPRALIDLAGAVHGIELRSPPALGDSIRRWLPALDRAYLRAPRPNVGYEDARRFAVQYGDSSARDLWIDRAAENGIVGNIWLMAQYAADDPRGNAAAELRRRALSSCDVPRGRYPLLMSAAEWRARCELYRGIAYTSLSSATLQAGRPRQALVEADSALSGVRRGEWCVLPRAHLAHARAALALGDSAMAESDFIAAAAGYPAGRSPVFDTAQAQLGTRFDRAAATVRLDSAGQVVRACADRLRALRQARERERAE